MMARLCVCFALLGQLAQAGRADVRARHKHQLQLISVDGGPLQREPAHGSVALQIDKPTHKSRCAWSILGDTAWSTPWL
jgi:hypothetical protein